MKIKLIIRFIVFMLVALTLSACVSTYAPYRGELSDAMEVASNDYKGERHLEVPDSAPLTETETGEPLSSDMADSTASPNGLATQPDDIDWKKSFMFSKGFGRVAGGDYQDHNNWIIRMGGENEKRTQTELYLGFEGVSLDSGSSLKQSVEGNLKILMVGVNLKRFFKPHSDKIRAYLSAGAGGAYMFWSYHNPFTTSDGETVNGDNLTGFTISSAAGIEYKPVRFIAIAIEINPKIHLWHECTGRGFDNDEFDPMGMMAISVGVSLTQ